MNELLAQSYASLHHMNCIGLRFFTVYGSWVREDMAAYKFLQALTNHKSITLYNNGEVSRDFTHVSDIIKSIDKICYKLNHSSSLIGSEIFNIGNGNPKQISTYLLEFEKQLQIGAHIVYKDLPSIELHHTHASTEKLNDWINYTPVVNLEEGVAEMCQWYLNHSKNTK